MSRTLPFAPETEVRRKTEIFRRQVRSDEDVELCDLLEMCTTFGSALFHKLLEHAQVVDGHLSFWNNLLVKQRWEQHRIMLFNRGPIPFFRTLYHAFRDRSHTVFREHPVIIGQRSRELGGLQDELLFFLGHLLHIFHDALKCDDLNSLHACLCRLVLAFERCMTTVAGEGKVAASHDRVASTIKYRTLSSILDADSAPSTVSALQARLSVCEEQLAYMDSFLSAFVTARRSPSGLAQRWIRYASLGAAAMLLGAYLFKHSRFNGSDDLSTWWRTAKLSVKTFYLEHLEAPILSVTKQIIEPFNTEKIIRATDVAAEKESLARMLANFSSPDHKPLDPAILEMAEQGDMRLVMDRYELELQKPLKNIVMGNLVEAILIQIQKLKVDMESAMLAIDQILRANQINVELLATIPAILLTFFVLKSIQAVLRTDTQRPHLESNVRLALAEVHRALTRQLSNSDVTVSNSVSEIEIGRLVFCLNRLLSQGRLIVSRNEFHRFKQDVLDILSPALSAEQKLHTASRMTWSYPSVFLPSLRVDKQSS